MKIQLYGDTSLVTSVAVEEVPAGLELIINTRDRWTQFHRSVTSVQHLLSMPLERVAEHDCIKVLGGDPDEIDAPACEVVFVPENEQELSLLRGIAYMQQEDDQVICLKMKQAQLAHIRTLGEFHPATPMKKVSPL